MKAFLMLLLLVCSQAYADELPPVIDNSAYPINAAPVKAVSQPASDAMYDMLARINQLQTEVQQLTGKVEEQANTIAELKQHQGTLYSDFDERLQGIENKLGSTAQPVVGNLQTPPSVTEDAVHSTAPPIIEPTVTDPPMAEKTQVVEADKPTPKPVVEDKPVVNAETKLDTSPASDVEKKEFQQAYGSLRAGNTDQSIEQFKAFQAKYSSGTYAANAQFWLGEAYRVKPDNDAARAAFNEVIKKYPNSPKQAEAILKLGLIEMDSKNTDKAREYLNRVISEFPNTVSAVAAKKKLTQLEAPKN